MKLIERERTKLAHALTIAAQCALDLGDGKT